MKAIIAAALMFPFVCFGLGRLEALSLVESGDRDDVVGAAGEISRYQIFKYQWQTVTNSTAYTDFRTARSVAVVLSNRNVEKFATKFKRPPTDFEFYVLWNAPAQAMSGKVSRVVAERAQRFENLCTSNLTSK